MIANMEKCDCCAYCNYQYGGKSYCNMIKQGTPLLCQLLYVADFRCRWMTSHTYLGRILYLMYVLNKNVSLKEIKMSIESFHSYNQCMKNIQTLIDAGYVVHTVVAEKDFDTMYRINQGKKKELDDFFRKNDYTL